MRRKIGYDWALKSGTTWSTEPGAENVLTWTAHPDQVPYANLWEVPESFALSGDVSFQNPFAVTFWDGENIIDTQYLKNGVVIPFTDFLQIQEKTDIPAVGVWKTT